MTTALLDPSAPAIDDDARRREFLAGGLAGRLAGVQRTVDRGVDNLELIARTRPDLILGAEYDTERYEQLSAIAPTVLLDCYGATVDDHIRLVGRILGREEDAERLVADWNERLAAIRARVRDSPLARSLVAMVAEDVYEGDFSAFGPKSYGGRTLTAVGVEVLDPGGRSDGEDFAFGSDLSTERLGVLAPADLILQQTYRADYEEARSIEDSPLWPQLPAVRADDVVEVDGHVWYQDTALSWLARLEDIERIATRKTGA